MAGNLVNHTVANLSGGVTQQFDESASEIQVREMINCIPTISRGVLRRNPITNSAGLMATLKSLDYFVYTYDRGNDNEQYVILIGSGEWHIFNNNTKVLVTEGTSAYLNIPVGVSPKNAFSMVTVGDFTFITNKYVKTAMSSIIDGIVDSHKKTGVYWIRQTSENTVSNQIISGNTGYLIEGYNYFLNGQYTKAYRNTIGGANIDVLKGDAIAKDLAIKLNYNYEGSFIYKTGLSTTLNWIWGDSNGNTASSGFKGEIQRPDMLPSQMPLALVDTIVNVTQNTVSSIDDYWLKFTGTNWIETMKPGMANTIASNTMPHCFVRTSTGGFSFIEYTESALSGIGIVGTAGLGWQTRVVGDELSSPIPSFINGYISQVFFHKNRLGFISNNNIILSENNNFGNFWATTVRTIPDTDVIDLTVATTDMSFLNFVVPTNSSIVLFANNAQYVLHSNNQSLTPTTATIDVASKYNNSIICSPIALANKIFYVSESGGYSQLFFYNLAQTSAITEALMLTQDVPSYLPKNIQLLTGNSALGYIFMWSPETVDTVYIYNNIISGNKLTQSSFHKWTFKGYTIIGLNIIRNKLIITLKLTTATTNISIGDIILELPGDFSTTNYTDIVAMLNTSFESYIEFSKWFIKDQNGNGSKNGRLQIHSIEYSINKKSSYATYIVTDDGTISTELGVWNDLSSWSDSYVWTDGIDYYTVVDTNNPKVCILGNSKDTLIVFKNDTLNSTKGFELETINFEGFYHQNSQRI